MSDNNGTGRDEEPQTSVLDRTFAVMLGELEDAESRLVQQQADLAKQLDAVSGELDRLQAVKAAMLGKRQTRRAAASTAAASGATGKSGQQAELNRKRVLQYAREHGGEFTGEQVAEATGLSLNGIGPILGHMARSGILKRETRIEPGRGAANPRAIYSLSVES